MDNNKYYIQLSAFLKEFYKVSVSYEEANSIFKPKKYLKKEFLCRANQIPDSLFFICKGLIKYYYIDYEGNECVKDFMGENMFGASYASLIKQVPSPYYIEALEETIVLEMNYKDLIFNISKYPIWKEIARLTAEYLYIFKERKESSLLLENAQTRYKRFINEYSSLSPRLKQKDIASFLNIKPESLSRIKRSKTLT